jgi:hypothetical protein
MNATIHTNGTTAHETDYGLDHLYAWWPSQAPAPAPLPEAAFSLTLKGTLDGIDALLTVRGMTATEFRTNLEAVRGLLTTPQAPVPASSQGHGWCQQHGVQMQRNDKNGRQWWSHKTAEGWCKGKGGRHA